MGKPLSLLFVRQSILQTMVPAPVMPAQHGFCARPLAMPGRLPHGLQCAGARNRYLQEGKNKFISLCVQLSAAQH